MAIAARIEQHLRHSGVHYDLVEHPLSHNSRQSASKAHIPAEKLAKAVAVHDGDRYCICVIPASHRLNMEAVNQHMHGHFTLVDEARISTMFDDCTSGAIPALGQAYGWHVIWDNSLNDCPDVYLEGGDHRHLIHLSHAGFAELMGRQEHLNVSHPERHRH